MLLSTCHECGVCVRVCVHVCVLPRCSCTMLWTGVTSLSPSRDLGSREREGMSEKGEGREKGGVRERES